jgi:hypothetical protein
LPSSPAAPYRLGMDTPRIGHNGGPPLDPEESWRGYAWRRAHQRAWKTPPREIALRRLARAEALGMTYRAYTLEILERGRFP